MKRIFITERQYRRLTLQENEGSTVMYHTCRDWDDPENFSRTGLWLSDEPDEAYGEAVYAYEVPDNLNIADQDTAMSFAIKYDEEGVKYACEMCGYDPGDEGDLYGAYDEILTEPEKSLGEGQWAYMLRKAGYDGFSFYYAGEYQYLYLFDPKSARLVGRER